MQDPRFNEQQIATFRNRLSVALHAELSAYQALLATVRERTELKIPFHETILISLLEKSFDNRTISLAISASEQKSQIAKWPQFTTPGPALEAAALQDPQGFMQSIREQVALNDSTIERIERIEQGTVTWSNCSTSAKPGRPRPPSCSRCCPPQAMPA